MGVRRLPKDIESVFFANPPAAGISDRKHIVPIFDAGP